MSSVVQFLARSLHAAATAPTEDGEHVYFLKEIDGSLAQEKWVNDDLEDKDFVTDGVKPNSPALYLANQHERYIFFIDSNNNLKCVVFDQDDLEWVDAPFNDTLAALDVSPDTRLSGFSSQWGMMIVFERESGRLSGLFGSNGDWKITTEFPIPTKPGAGHTTLEYKEELHLFCLGEDEQIHHLVQDSSSKEWITSAVQDSKFDSMPTRIVAMPPADDTSAFDLYVLLDDLQLFQIKGEAAKNMLGVVNGGRLVPGTAAECCFLLPLAIKALQFIINPWRSAPGSTVEREKKTNGPSWSTHSSSCHVEKHWYVQL